MSGQGWIPSADEEHGTLLSSPEVDGLMPEANKASLEASN